MVRPSAFHSATTLPRNSPYFESADEGDMKVRQINKRDSDALPANLRRLKIRARAYGPIDCIPPLHSAHLSRWGVR
jgi:hypothetical protein